MVRAAESKKKKKSHPQKEIFPLCVCVRDVCVSGRRGGAGWRHAPRELHVDAGLRAAVCVNSFHNRVGPIRESPHLPTSLRPFRSI